MTATIIPSLFKIKSEITPISDANLYLLERLERGLSSEHSEYTIFYKPILNGYYPDIVIYKENHGILIIKTMELDSIDDIEIEDNNISTSYNILKNSLSLLFNMKNEFSQYDEKYNLDLMKYKVYNIALKHNDKIKSNLTISNPASIIKQAFYFPNLTKNEVKKIKEKINFYDSILWYSKDETLISDIINKMKANNIYFHETIKALRAQLNPSIERIDQGNRIIFNQQQIKLSTINYPEEKKISGKAGSGKTLVLAKKSINAYNETRKPVLILCFNITLVNYIKLQISRLLENELDNQFYIDYFHHFMRKLIHKYGIKYENKEDQLKFKNVIKSLSSIKLNDEDRYQTILIDEVQDFEYHWLEFLKNNILLPEGSYTIFGDAKQNIYDIEPEQDENKNKNIKTNVIGRWNDLKQGYRFGLTIKMLSSFYQKEYLSDYEALEDETNIEADLLATQDYVYLKNSTAINIELLSNEIKKALDFLISQHKLNQNDISIIGCDITNELGLVEIESQLRLSNERYRTITSFETKEEQELILEYIEKMLDGFIPHKQFTYKKIRQTTESFSSKISSFKKIIEEYNNSEKTHALNIIEQEIYSYRQNKKNRFSCLPNAIKLSSVHSFKGWDSHCVILIITEGTDMDKMKELIYVGITRAKEILYIINTKPELDDFFIEFASKNPFVVLVE